MVKSMKKRVAALALAGMVCLSTVPGVFADVNFKDIEKVTWANKTIVKWLDAGMVKGYGADFKPNQSITRAEFAKLVVEAFNLTTGAEASFKDVPKIHWAYSYIAALSKAGMIKGYADGSFLPSAEITRAEAAKVLAAAKGLSDNAKALDQFKDLASTPTWAKGAMGALVSKGWMGGYPDKTLKASAQITRAESIVAIDRVAYHENQMARSWVLNLAGQYGGTATAPKVIEGDLYIRSKDVVLQHVEVKGNLIFGKEIGKGDVALKSVVVKGETRIYGGGINSITLEDVTLANVIIEKHDGEIRIVVQGKTEMVTLSVKSGVKLVNEGVLKDKAFGLITIEVTAEGKIILDGNFGKVVVKSDDVNVVVSKGTVIKEVVLDGAAVLEGEGKVENAVVNNKGAELALKPDRVVSPEVVVNPPAGGNTGGSTGGNTGGNTNPVVVMKDYKFKVYYSDGRVQLLDTKKYDQETALSLAILETLYADLKGLVSKNLDSYVDRAIENNTSIVYSILMMVDKQDNTLYLIKAADNIKKLGAENKLYAVLSAQDRTTLMAICDRILAGKPAKLGDAIDKGLMQTEAKALTKLVLNSSLKLTDFIGDAKALFPTEFVPQEITISVNGTVLSTTGMKGADLEKALQTALSQVKIKDAVGKDLVKVQVGKAALTFKIEQ